LSGVLFGLALALSSGWASALLARSASRAAAGSSSSLLLEQLVLELSAELLLASEPSSSTLLSFGAEAFALPQSAPDSTFSAEIFIFSPP